MYLYELGEKVRLITRDFKISEHWYKIEGYSTRVCYHRGEMRKEIYYVLRNKHNGKLVQTTPYFVFKPKTVDELLDDYNDHHFLFSMFQDDKYQKEMEYTKGELKKMVEWKLIHTNVI